MMNMNSMGDTVCVGDQVVGAGCMGEVLELRPDGTADVMTATGDVMNEVCYHLLVVDQWEEVDCCAD